MGAKMYIETPCPDSDDRMHENNVNHYSVMGSRMLHNLIARAGFKYANSQSRNRQTDARNRIWSNSNKRSILSY